MPEKANHASEATKKSKGIQEAKVPKETKQPTEVFVEYKHDVPMPRSGLPACPVETCVALVGSKWRLLILRDLLHCKKMRFGELKRSIGSVSQKVLTSNLRDMEEAGLVVRRVFPEVPPRVEYSLTETGRSLSPVIDAMFVWGKAYQAKAR